MENWAFQFITRLAHEVWFSVGRTLATRSASFLLLAPTFSLLALVAGGESVHLQNAGFESSIPGEFWQVDQSERKQSFSISVDRSEMKEGQQALLITAKQPVHLTLRQEVFLPVGTLWRVTGWTKSQASAVSSKADAYSEKPSPGPRIGIEAEVGAQGFGPNGGNAGDWQQQILLFRVPSPGRMTVALNIFNSQSGKVWLDDIRLERVPQTA
jgi:hypothetical protein